MTKGDKQMEQDVPSAEDIAFTVWFSGHEGFSRRCERFAEECGLDDARQYQDGRRWLRAAFGMGAAYAQAIEGDKR